MRSRSERLLLLRPEITTTNKKLVTSSAERFQNDTLRPVIKFQNPLFIIAFRNYIGKHKNTFYNLTLEGRLAYLENVIQKDFKFRNSLKGMVIGQFTLEEYEEYICNSSALNKRMMSMVTERLKDQIQVFETPLEVEFLKI